ncbi:C4-dicarboxylate ABC transporter [Salipaludibacillus neizhouensis]|uniref:C4-dicarboxylate ABC transporter n=1 Tax=Salipaludibacillus neizhouensis TaxID=885475 RepID=A0A3A9K190_9BACI|nr:TRAP transporter large permease [Salipaludibacillus neizhouensis]RKL66497.1 C4-dicarboxylate ABC transporter [Salipaludibacillus neizhouensis]
MTMMLIVFFILIFANIPIAFAIGISGLLYFITSPDIMNMVAIQQYTTGTQSFPLLAVPFFVLAGHILNVSGITTRLINFANLLTGHLVGGLAHVSIVLSTMLGGISGSATADAAMQSRILTNDMVKRGYSKGFSIGVIGVSSLITSTIPPSIGLILYGFIGGVSIGDLFMAGIIPGILMCFTLMLTVYLVSTKRGYDAGRSVEKPTFKELVVSFKDCIWALLFPIILLVGIRFGIFSASEGGAVAVVYAILVGRLIYKELTWKKFKTAIVDAVQDNSMIMLIIAAASIFSYVIAFENLPRSFSEFTMGVTTNPTLLLLLILLIVFIAGLFMEATANTLLLTPIFLPIVQQAGVDPVHFGILMIVLITLGGMTPPLGVTMLAVCSITKTSVTEFSKGAFPFLIAVIFLIIILVFFPQIVLFLPNTF